MRVRLGPGERFFFCLEISIDYDRVALTGRSAAEASGSPVDHVRPGVDSGKNLVAEHDLAAEWNFFRINRAMTGTKPRAVPESAFS